MLSQTVEYALRAIVTLAQQDGQPCTASKIAEITKVPAPYLSKLMQGLVRGELVDSQRGLRGGFVLRKSPTEITIWDVVDQIEPIKRIESCPLGIKGHGCTLCPLHRRMDDAIASIESIYQGTSIADLLNQPGGPTPLCEDRRSQSSNE